jgi:DNA polymerase-3 subunit gamma/tau
MADADPASHEPYRVLARKYRSRTFDEVVGQKHVAETLKRAIGTGRVHHAYLFCGTRGVGKTSMARILALALNDPTSDQATAEPDPTTETADAIFRGDDVDVIEIDAASNTGVDNVRELIENARFRPMRSRFKVYIIDEAHMLSKAAFNALLKIMEEPPEHVKFVLATTEPEKILPTILSRVQRFDFRDLPSNDVVGHLRHVIEGEGRSADATALEMVARNGQGSMRDSLSLLDRLLAALDAKETLDVDAVTRLLGLPPRERVAKVVDAIAEGEPKAALQETADLLVGGLGVDALIASLVEHLHVLLIRATLGSAAPSGDLPGLAEAVLDRQARAFDPAGLSQAIAILEELRRQMRQAGGTARALFDATLVRLALAKQFTPLAQLMNAAAGVSDNSNGATTTTRAEKKTADITPPEPEAAPEESSQEPEATPDGDADLPPDLTERVIARLTKTHPSVAGLLERSGFLTSEDGQGIDLILPGGERIASIVGTDEKRQAVAEALQKVLDRKTLPDLRVLAGEDDGSFKQPGNAPPSELDLSADPLVQAAVRELGARVVKVEDA